MSDTETPIHLVVGMVLDGVGDADERQRVGEYIKRLEGERDELRAKLAIVLGADKPNRPATARERARHWALEAAAQKERAEVAEAKYQCELEYRLTLSRTVNAELKLLNASTQRAEKWKARAEALEERNDTTPLDAIKTVVEYSEFQGWSNTEAVDAFRKLGDWLQFRV